MLFHQVFHNCLQQLTVSNSYIVDLNIVYSNYLKSESIIQLSSALIDNDYKNYKNNDIFIDPDGCEGVIGYNEYV